MTREQMITKLRSPHADKVYVGKDFTKADLIAALEAEDAKQDWTGWLKMVDDMKQRYAHTYEVKQT